MLATRHRQPHAEEHTSELAILHAFDEIVALLKRHACLCRGLFADLLILNQRSQNRNQFKVLTRANLQEDVRGFRALRRANVDQYGSPVFSASWQEFTLRHQCILREVSRMTLSGVASPIHNEISSVLHFTERASNFATQLSSDFGGTVSQGCVAIQQTT